MYLKYIPKFEFLMKNTIYNIDFILIINYIDFSTCKFLI